MPSQAKCAEPDSLYENIEHAHRLRVRDVAIPTSVVTISALFVENKWLKKQRLNAQKTLSAIGNKKFKADDYIQYLPMVSVYGFNLFGVKGRHSFKDRTIILGMAYAIQTATVHCLKYALKEKRPDSSSHNSFPSGHTATAFTGAQFLYEEYKTVSPWIGYAGYAVATITGYLRIYNNRHYINDVVAGACLGILSTKLAYWLYPKCFKFAECNDSRILMTPYYLGNNIGVSICIRY